jgi:hypothetical protein
MRIPMNAGVPAPVALVAIVAVVALIASVGRVPSAGSRAGREVPAPSHVVDSTWDAQPVRPAPGTPADETTEGRNDPTSPRIADIAHYYRSLRSMTTQPVSVDPRLAMLCRGAQQSEVEAARKTTGPHANSYIRIYMNDLAAKAFRGRSTSYPVGSVIVKEKRPRGSWFEETGRPVHQSDGVGGMVKRPPGYDTAHGDWEYFYFEEGSKIEGGRIASCAGCHGGASTRDYVFGGWAGSR